MKKFLGIDIGGTHIKYGVYDELGKEYSHGKINSIQDDLNGIILVLKEIIETHQDIAGIGLSIPGGVNSDTGFIIEGGACEALDQTDLISYLKDFTTLPIAIENDANCATLAEAWIGNGQGMKNFICITVGTGIGGGIVINHELYTGSHYFAGEFGYMLGRKEEGLSIYASTYALVHQVQDKIHVKYLDGEMIFEMMSKGDTEVIDAYRSWLHGLTVGIYNIASCFDPECVLIGGGISGQDKLISDIKAELKQIQEYDVEWDIKVCGCHNHAGKIGAIYNLMKKVGIK